MTVLITGAAGFLGRNLAAALLHDGHRVVGVDTFRTSDRHDLATLLRRREFTFVEMDVTAPAFPAVARGLDLSAIYHLACPTGVPDRAPLALEMLETCYTGSKAVLELAAVARTPVVLASAAEVYGNPAVSPQRETYTGNVDTLGARKASEEGKRVAETLFGIYAECHGVPAKIARIYNTYGPGMSLDDTRVAPSFMRAAIEDRPLVIHGDGSQTRCHVYVDDMVAGLRTVIHHGEPARAYNLGTQHQLSVRALAERVLRVTGSRSPIVLRSRPTHDHDGRLPDITRAMTELGWRPLIGLDEGLRQMLADFSTRLAAREQVKRDVA